MEFVFQILADLLSPVDEKQLKAEKEKINKAEKKEVVVDAVEETKEEPNLFGIMDFH